MKKKSDSGQKKPDRSKKTKEPALMRYLGARPRPGRSEADNLHRKDIYDAAVGEVTRDWYDR